MYDELVLKDELQMITAEIDGYNIKIEGAITSVMAEISFSAEDGKTFNVIADSNCQSLDELVIEISLAGNNYKSQYKGADFKADSWLYGAAPIIKENSEKIRKAAKILLKIIELNWEF